MENVDYITSAEALRLKYQPKTLTIIGGGYIACELAHFFGALGTKINIIQRNNFLLPNEDIDVSMEFTKIFSKKYNVFLGYDTEMVSYIYDNTNNQTKKKMFNVMIMDKFGKSIEIESEQLLIATGRIPNLDLLNIEKENIKLNENGFILVD